MSSEVTNTVIHMRDAVIRLAEEDLPPDQRNQSLDGHSAFFQAFAAAIDQLVKVRVDEVEARIRKRYEG